MQRCNQNLHKTPALKKEKKKTQNECPYTKGPLYSTSRTDDTAKICVAEFVVFPKHLM